MSLQHLIRSAWWLVLALALVASVLPFTAASRKSQPPPQAFPSDDYYGDDGDLPWHLQPLADVGLAAGLAPPTNQRLLTTMELHMVDVKNEERQVAANRQAALESARQEQRAEQEQRAAQAQREALVAQQQQVWITLCTLHRYEFTCSY